MARRATTPAARRHTRTADAPGARLGPEAAEHAERLRPWPSHVGRPRAAAEHAERLRPRASLAGCLLALALVAGPIACASSGGEAPGSDATVSTDAAGASDAGALGADAALDAAPELDAGDAGDVRDGGADADATARDAGLVAPAGLVRYLVGRAADRDVAPRGPGVIVMGGGPDVDEAFTWWRPLVAGGDVVVLRTSGADGYNDYLFTDIGGVDSVHTLLVTTRALADDAWVEAEVASAEAIFLAGGDQATYVDAWKGTGVERGLRAAWARGAVVGGTSAGAAVLGELVFGAHRGTVTSDEVLADPYDARVTIDDALVDLEPLRGVITDTHFAERDRMGRLVGFVARVLADGHRAPVRGLGVSEHTALVIGPDRVGTVLGTGHVYVVEGLVPAEVCAPGAPLTYRDVAYRTLAPGDTITLPRGTTTVPAETLDVEAGTLSPADPY